MELPKDTPDAFNCLISWLYWDKIPSVQKPILPTDAEHCKNFTKSVLYPGYILAEKLCLDEMANEIINVIQDVQYQSQILPDAQDMKLIYENTPENSKLRLYCATAVAFFLSQQADFGQAKEFAGLCSTIPDFALDVFQVHQVHGNFIYDVNNPCDPRLRAKTSLQKATTKFTACHFHTHEDHIDVCPCPTTYATVGEIKEDSVSDTSSTMGFAGMLFEETGLRNSRVPRTTSRYHVTAPYSFAN
jgi:hypothetical protein